VHELYSFWRDKSSRVCWRVSFLFFATLDMCAEQFCIVLSGLSPLDYTVGMCICNRIGVIGFVEIECDGGLCGALFLPLPHSTPHFELTLYCTDYESHLLGDGICKGVENGEESG